MFGYAPDDYRRFRNHAWRYLMLFSVLYCFLYCTRLNLSNAGAVIMEPVMKVAVEGPSEFQGAVMGSINQRRGVIIGTSEENNYTVVEAEVPLVEMFGYSTVLRSLTQGKAEFSMEFATYRQVPKGVAEQLIKDFEASKKN